MWIEADGRHKESDLVEGDDKEDVEDWGEE